jgi:hypothetical protein
MRQQLGGTVITHLSLDTAIELYILDTSSASPPLIRFPSAPSNRLRGSSRWDHLVAHVAGYEL